MELFRWDIALLVGIPPLIAVVVGVLVVRRWVGSPAAHMRGAARRLGGRMDPAGESSRSAAMLVELGGCLLRVSYPRSEGRRLSREMPPSVEVCTPVENTALPVAVVRLSDESWALDLVGIDTMAEPIAERARDGVLLYGQQTAVWAVAQLRKHDELAFIELDSRMLRAVTCDRDGKALDGTAIERLVRSFASLLPEVLRAAGVSGSSVRRERD